MENLLDNELNQTDLIKQSLVLASKQKRFLNLILDSIFVVIIVVIVSMLFGILLVMLGYTEWLEEEETRSISSELFDRLFGTLIYVAYYAFFEAIFGKTIGKMITGTKVVTSDGTKPSLNQIIGRSFARIVPFEAFSFLGGDDDSGWHDRWTGTIVVEEKSLLSFK